VDVQRTRIVDGAAARAYEDLTRETRGAPVALTAARGRAMLGRGTNLIAAEFG
jgi:hypothetical protein